MSDMEIDRLINYETGELWAPTAVQEAMRRNFDDQIARYHPNERRPRSSNHDDLIPGAFDTFWHRFMDHRSS